MNWEIKPTIKLSIKTVNGGELIAETTKDGGCFISTRTHIGIHSNVTLTKEQLEELKFWLVMN